VRVTAGSQHENVEATSWNDCFQLVSCEDSTKPTSFRPEIAAAYRASQLAPVLGCTAHSIAACNRSAQKQGQSRSCTT